MMVSISPRIMDTSPTMALQLLDFPKVRCIFNIMDIMDNYLLMKISKY